VDELKQPVPYAWLGKQVEIEFQGSAWRMAPGVLQEVSELGITLQGDLQRSIMFYPWNAIHGIRFRPEDDA
jgi:hypothetical protein